MQEMNEPSDSTNDPSKSLPDARTDLAKTAEQENQLTVIVPVVPVVGEESFAVKDLPDASWSEEQLVQEVYATLTEMLGHHKRMASDVVRLGAALVFLQPPLKKRREWTKFLGTIGLHPTTAWRAIKVYGLATIENGVATLTINEAYKVLDLVPDPKAIADDSLDDTNANGIEVDGSNANDAKAIEADAANDEGKVGLKKKGGAGKPTKPHKAKKTSKKLRRKAKLSGMTARIAEGPLDDEEEEEESGEAFLSEVWPYETLRKIRSRLEHLAFEIKAIAWDKESVTPEDYREMCDDIVLAVNALTEKLASASATEDAPESEEPAIGPKATAEDVSLPPRISEGFVAAMEKDGKVGCTIERHDGKYWLMIAETERAARLAADGLVPKPVVEVAESINKKKRFTAGVCFVTAQDDDSLVREFLPWGAM